MDAVTTELEATTVENECHECLRNLNGMTTQLEYRIAKSESHDYKAGKRTVENECPDYNTGSNDCKK